MKRFQVINPFCSYTNLPESLPSPQAFRTLSNSCQRITAGEDPRLTSIHSIYLESLTSLSAPFSSHPAFEGRSNEQLLFEAVRSGGPGSGLERNAATQIAITTARTI